MLTMRQSIDLNKAGTYQFSIGTTFCDFQYSVSFVSESCAIVASHMYTRHMCMAENKERNMNKVSDKNTMPKINRTQNWLSIILSHSFTLNVRYVRMYLMCMANIFIYFPSNIGHMLVRYNLANLHELMLNAERRLVQASRQA